MCSYGKYLLVPSRSQGSLAARMPGTLWEDNLTVLWMKG